jgi:hypothetical protein
MSQVNKFASQPISDARIDELADLLYEAAIRSCTPRQDIRRSETDPTTGARRYEATTCLTKLGMCNQSEGKSNAIIADAVAQDDDRPFTWSRERQRLVQSFPGSGGAFPE